MGIGSWEESPGSESQLIWGLTRSDITFSNHDSHALLWLKRSNADTELRGIDIVLAASTDDTCPVKALWELFQRQPLTGDQPLFGFDGGPLR